MYEASLLLGNPTVVTLLGFRLVALRPRLSYGPALILAMALFSISLGLTTIVAICYRISACDKLIEPKDKGLKEMEKISRRWADSNQLVVSTPMILMSNEVANMQSIKRDLDSTVVSECLEKAKVALGEHMELMIRKQWDGRSHLNGIEVCQSGDANQPLKQTGASDMKVTTVGIDLAKNVFQLHGVNEFGKTVIKKQLRRDQVSEYFVNLPACLIGMEACGSAHYWARKLQDFGHTVKLMAPQFVKPYVKTNKNDAADAEAICEAVARPNMRFVPIKNVEQQAVLALHRVRQGFVKARTAQANQIRGLLGEFGLIIPQGIGYIATRVPELIEDASNELPGSFRILVQRLLDHLKELDRQVGELEVQIQTWHRHSDASCKLAQIPGIGPITASALVASIGDAKNFDSGRQVAAWLGLVPKQHSSGGKQNLLSISKRGDAYLRTLLIHGARSVIYRAVQKPESCSWINGVVNRRNKNVAAVALANKNARIVWALLAHDREFRSDYTTAKAAT
jgi:transposase